jgi:hypothetical protein
MATYNKSISISQIITSFYGTLGGVLFPNQTDFVYYTCPSTIAYARVYVTYAYANNINGLTTLTLQRVIPGITPRETFYQHALNGTSGTHELLLKGSYAKLDLIDLANSAGYTDAFIATNKSVTLMPGEMIYASLTDTGGSIGPTEWSAVQVQIIEIIT